MLFVTRRPWCCPATAEWACMLHFRAKTGKCNCLFFKWEIRYFVISCDSSYIILSLIHWRLFTVWIYFNNKEVHDKRWNLKMYLLTWKNPPVTTAHVLRKQLSPTICFIVGDARSHVPFIIWPHTPSTLLFFVNSWPVWSSCNFNLG